MLSGIGYIGAGISPMLLNSRRAAEPGPTAPTITSPSVGSVAENAPFSMLLTANQAVSWSIVGGADQALFSLDGDELTLPAQDYEAPADDDEDGAYVVTVRATNGDTLTADKTITVTVTDVNDEAVTFDSNAVTFDDDTRSMDEAA